MESRGDEEEAGVAVSWETPAVEWLAEGIGLPGEILGDNGNGWDWHSAA